MEIHPSITALITAPTTTSDATKGGEVISVSSATKRIAFAYERFRNTLEPDEEDILRRKAIYRILERRLQEDRPPLVSATALLQELIRGHYIKGATVALAQRIAEILTWTQAIQTQASSEVADWFLRLVAVAIDRELYPRQQEEGLVYLLYENALARVVWADDLVGEQDRATQLYSACHRALFAADDYEITYHFFIHNFPAWGKGVPSPDELVAIFRTLPKFHQQLTQLVAHPARERLTRLLKKAAVPYRIILDIIRDRPDVLQGTSAEFELAARETIQHRMQRIRQRMSNRIWHSILFLFLTKTLIGIVIELPYEIIFLQRPHWLALAVNIAFHPLLLFFSATSARLPGQANTDRLVAQVEKIVTGEGELPTIILSKTRSYGALTWSLFALVYALLFMGIFWGMFSILARLNFSLVAMAMFVVFLGLVSFLAIRIRHSVDAVRVVSQREGALATVFSFLSLPVLEFGRFLAQNISQVNVALFLMDRVLEAPFKLLIDVTEEWFSFVKDRREEIT